MNSFALMMAASRAINKKEEVIKIKPVVMKRKVGRPAAVKKPEQPIVPFPVVDLTQTSNAIVSRKNYDRGQAKVMMDFALQVALQSKGRHLKRTALMYGVERKPLSVRYHLAVNGVADGPTGKTILLLRHQYYRVHHIFYKLTSEKPKRGSRCILPFEVEDKLALFCRYMASCNLAIDRTLLNLSAVNLSVSCGIKDFKASKSSTWYRHPQFNVLS